MSEVTLQYLWHRVRVASDDDEFVAGLQLRSAEHELVPEVDLAYFIAVAGADRYEVYEGADHLVSTESARRAEQEIAERVERRAFEMLDLKGWARFRATLCPTGEVSGSCGLVLATSTDDSLPEGRVALRDGWVVELPGPDSPLVGGQGLLRFRPLTFLAFAEAGSGVARAEPLGQLSTVRALMGCADPLSPSPRQNVRVAVEVARQVPSYVTWAASLNDIYSMIDGLTSS